MLEQTSLYKPGSYSQTRSADLFCSSIKYLAPLLVCREIPLLTPSGCLRLKRPLLNNSSSSLTIDKECWPIGLVSCENNDNFLKAYNIYNKNLFWKVNISEKIKKNTKIINISNFNNSIIIFFNNGLILEVNSKNGNIISEKNLKTNDIISIQNANEYLLVDQINGKTAIFVK